MTMATMRIKDPQFFRKRSTGSPERSIDLDAEPSPTIMANGIRSVTTSKYEIMDDGRPFVPDASKPPYRVPSMPEINALPWNGMTVATFFAGGGGSSLGYRMAGFRVLYANEFVPAAQESYRANARPGTHLDGRDVRDVKPEEVLEACKLRRGELDVLDGSPPCQAFSTAGSREKGWGTERRYEHGARQRNEDLFFEFVRIRDGIMPRAFVAENVSGLVKGVAKGYFINILKALKRGYRVECRLLDAQWLGVPQARQRIFFVGVREDLGLEPAFPSPLPYRYSVREALPWLGRVVHDTSGQPQYSAGDITDRPAPPITTGLITGKGKDALNSRHFHVEDARAVQNLRRGAGKDAGDFTDRPAPTITADADRAAQFSVVHDTGRKGQRARDVSDLPAPTITAGPNDAADGGGPRNHFKVVQNKNATHSRKGEERGEDLPAPTLLSRRANVEIAYKGQKGGQKWGERRRSVDEPSASISGGGYGGAARHQAHVVEPETDFSKNAIAVEYDRLNPGQASKRYMNLVRADANEPSPTITAIGGSSSGTASVAHPTEKRKFSILEVKRLSSFPDDYELKGTYGQQWERLGNSVPPVMMFHVARVLAELLERGRSRTPARARGSQARSTKATRPKGAGRRRTSRPSAAGTQRAPVPART